MARRGNDDDLLLEEELTAAFLGDEDMGMDTGSMQQADDAAADDWDDPQNQLPGQLALDVYETSTSYLLRLAPQE